MLGRRASCWGWVAVSHVLLSCNFGTWSSSQGEAVPQRCWYLCSVVKQAGQPCTMCFPSATELAAVWGHPCLQLGDTLAFLSPLLVNCMGSHFLNHLQGEPAGSFLSFPLALNCKQVGASYSLPQCPGWGGHHPSPPFPQAFYSSSYSVTS